MTVKVFLKDGRAFDYGETAILDDKEAGWVALSIGTISGGRVTKPRYGFTDESHIVYAWRDIERLEVTQ